jgi:hypothetical protein
MELALQLPPSPVRLNRAGQVPAVHGISPAVVRRERLSQ